MGALAAIGLWLLNPLFRVLAQTNAREVMTAAALLVVLGAALLIVESTRHYCPQVKLLVRAFKREHALEPVKHDAIT